MFSFKVTFHTDSNSIASQLIPRHICADIGAHFGRSLPFMAALLPS